MALIFLALVVFVILRVEPYVLADVGIRGLYLPLLFLLWFFIVTLLMALRIVWWRVLVWSVGVILLIVLRLMGLGSLINAGLILALILVFEYYMKISQEELSGKASE